MIAVIFGLIYLRQELKQGMKFNEKIILLFLIDDKKILIYIFMFRNGTKYKWRVIFMHN